jgi:hypothetical protein
MRSFVIGSKCSANGGSTQYHAEHADTENG